MRCPSPTAWSTCTCARSDSSSPPEWTMPRVLSWTQGCARTPPERPADRIAAPLNTALLAPASSTAAELERLCLTPRQMVPGHRIRWLFGGALAYPAMLDAIALARSEILLEMYIWASDTNGRRFVDAVCIKAQEGVRVRCVIDGAGSFGFSGDDVAKMRSAGVLLSVFHPVGPWRRRWGWQVRDHRK